MFPLIMRVRSEQGAISVWKTHIKNVQTSIPLTLTHWVESTPRSITQTDPSRAPSSESVA